MHANKPTNRFKFVKVLLTAQTIIEINCHKNTKENKDINTILMPISFFKNGLSLLEYSKNFEFI